MFLYNIQTMISYDNPICPVSDCRANLFCCTEGCSRPAFACVEDCLYAEGHSNHQAMPWNAIEEHVRVVMELPLSKGQLLHLEKQEKQLKIITEELKAMQDNHQKAIINCKRRLNLNQIARKVLVAIKQKSTSAVTGDDMAKLLMSLQINDLFTNKQNVRKAMSERNELLDNLLPKLNILLNQYRQTVNNLLRPEFIPDSNIIQKSKINKKGEIKKYKIILLGDHNTGKTQIMERYVDDVFFVQTKPTIGVEFHVRQVNYKNNDYRLQLWDTSGQERYRSLIPNYIRDSICAIYVFDLSNLKSLRNIEDWIHMFKDYANFPTVSVICGNKRDLHKDFDRKKLDFILQNHNLPFYEVSALTGQNIKEMFFNIIEQINKINADPPVDKQKTLAFFDFGLPPITKNRLFLNHNEETNQPKGQHIVNGPIQTVENDVQWLNQKL